MTHPKVGESSVGQLARSVPFHRGLRSLWKRKEEKTNGVRIGRYSLPRSPLRHIVSYFLFLFFSLKCVFGLPPLLLPHPSLSNHPTAITPLLSSVYLGLLTSLMGISINTGALGPSGPWRLNVWHLEPRRQIPMWSGAASPWYLFFSLFLLEKRDLTVFESLPVCTFLESWQAPDSPNLHTYLQIRQNRWFAPIIFYTTPLLSLFDF